LNRERIAQEHPNRGAVSSGSYPERKENIMTKNLFQRSLIVSALLLAGSVAFAQLGLVVAASPSKAASTALLLTSASTAIKNCAFDSRNALLADIESRVRAARDAVADLEREARSLAGEARDDFKSALKDVRMREGALQESIRTAKRATKDGWPDQRALLASNYGDYAGAVTRLETAASAPGPE
jgi:hypothetical protein